MCVADALSQLGIVRGFIEHRRLRHSLDRSRLLNRSWKINVDFRSEFPRYLDIECPQLGVVAGSILQSQAHSLQWNEISIITLHLLNFVRTIPAAVELQQSFVLTPQHDSSCICIQVSDPWIQRGARIGRTTYTVRRAVCRISTG